MFIYTEHLHLLPLLFLCVQPQTISIWSRLFCLWDAPGVFVEKVLDELEWWLLRLQQKPTQMSCSLLCLVLRCLVCPPRRLQQGNSPRTGRCRCLTLSCRTPWDVWAPTRRIVLASLPPSPAWRVLMKQVNAGSPAKGSLRVIFKGRLDPFLCTQNAYFLQILFTNQWKTVSTSLFPK